MATLVIQSPLAEQIQKIAEQEQRPVEAVLEAMIARYGTPLSDEEIDARLRAVGIIVPEPGDDEPPISEEELEEIANRIGAQGSLSSLIIEERKQGW